MGNKLGGGPVIIVNEDLSKEFNKLESESLQLQYSQICSKNTTSNNFCRQNSDETLRLLKENLDIQDCGRSNISASFLVVSQSPAENVSFAS